MTIGGDSVYVTREELRDQMTALEGRLGGSISEVRAAVLRLGDKLDSRPLHTRNAVISVASIGALLLIAAASLISSQQNAALAPVEARQAGIERELAYRRPEVESLTKEVYYHLGFNAGRQGGDPCGNASSLSSGMSRPD